MKKSYSILALLLGSLFIQGTASAATSEVIWTDYKKYSDIKSGNENRKSFRERTFKTLEKHFAKLAAQLPTDQVLKIDVTNVDLAGDTHIGGINQIRIIKDLYIPRMNFSYELVAANGDIIKSETVVLKDMGFMTNSNLKYRNSSLGYEKKMLDDWFKVALAEHVFDKK